MFCWLVECEYKFRANNYVLNMYLYIFLVFYQLNVKMWIRSNHRTEVDLKNKEPFFVKVTMIEP